MGVGSPGRLACDTSLENSFVVPDAGIPGTHYFICVTRNITARPSTRAALPDCAKTWPSASYEEGHIREFGQAGGENMRQQPRPEMIPFNRETA
jgi:hypothetical protein